MKRKEVLKARNSSSGRHGKSANLPFDLISGSDAVVARFNHRLTQPSREPRVEHSPYTCACGLLGKARPPDTKSKAVLDV